MIMMSSYYGIIICDIQKEEYLMSIRKVYTFQHEEVFSRHYLYIILADNHNDMCHYDGTKT